MQAAGLARSFQITNLFFDLPVSENLRLAAQVLEPLSMVWRPVRASRVALARVEELLERFGSPTRRNILQARCRMASSAASRSQSR